MRLLFKKKNEQLALMLREKGFTFDRKPVGEQAGRPVGEPALTPYGAYFES